MIDAGNWKLFLSAAGSNNPVEPYWSEMFLRNALEFAEMTYGEDSSQAGICLMELADFLEKWGRFEEAEEMTERYRDILCHYIEDLGILD